MISIFLSALKNSEDIPLFTKFYLRHRSLLMRVALCATHNQALAEDAVEDAFLALADRFHLIEDPDGERAKRYAIRTVHGFAVDAVRRETRFVPFDYETYLSSDDPFDEVQRGDILRLIENLPDADREILTAKYVEGRSTKELCSRFEATEDAVYKRLSRAREKLKDALINNGYGGYFDE